MNCQLENINVTQRDGRVTHLDRVYIRGSHVRLFIVPDMLKYVPPACLRSEGKRLTTFTGTRPCSVPRLREDGVLGWQEAGLRYSVRVGRAGEEARPEQQETARRTKKDMRGNRWTSSSM